MRELTFAELAFINVLYAEADETQADIESAFDRIHQPAPPEVVDAMQNVKDFLRGLRDSKRIVTEKAGSPEWDDGSLRSAVESVLRGYGVNVADAEIRETLDEIIPQLDVLAEVIDQKRKDPGRHDD